MELIVKQTPVQEAAVAAMLAGVTARTGQKSMTQLIAPFCIAITANKDQTRSMGTRHGAGWPSGVERFHSHAFF